MISLYNFTETCQNTATTKKADIQQTQTIIQHWKTSKTTKQTKNTKTPFKNHQRHHKHPKTTKNGLTGCRRRLLSVCPQLPFERFDATDGRKAGGGFPAWSVGGAKGVPGGVFGGFCFFFCFFGVFLFFFWFCRSSLVSCDENSLKCFSEGFLDWCSIFNGKVSRVFQRISRVFLRFCFLGWIIFMPLALVCDRPPRDELEYFVYCKVLKQIQGVCGKTFVMFRWCSKLNDFWS